MENRIKLKYKVIKDKQEKNEREFGRNNNHSRRPIFPITEQPERLSHQDLSEQSDTPADSGKVTVKVIFKIYLPEKPPSQGIQSNIRRRFVPSSSIDHPKNSKKEPNVIDLYGEDDPDAAPCCESIGWLVVDSCEKAIEGLKTGWNELTRENLGRDFYVSPGRREKRAKLRSLRQRIIDRENPSWRDSIRESISDLFNPPDKAVAELKKRMNSRSFDYPREFHAKGLLEHRIERDYQMPTIFEEDEETDSEN